MDISYLGHSAFKLKGKKVTVVTDPFDPVVVGLKFPKNTSADIVTVSHSHADHNYTAIVEKNDDGQIIFNGPGDYESRGVEILGVETFHDNKEGKERGKNTLYRIDIDGISVVHCGDLGHQLSEAQVEQIDSTDVLLIPVGGHFTIDAHEASKIIAELEPSFVIPMHYSVPGLNSDLASVLAPLSVFLKEMGKEDLVAVPKLTVSKDKLPEELQIVVLE